MKHSLILGADIGGSHITTALVETQHWTLLEHTRSRAAVDPSGAANKILSSWCTLIQETLAKSPELPTAFGLAIPGPFNYQQGISLMQGQNKYDSLYGVNVKKSIADFFNIKIEDITIINDAESFLEGELRSGVGKGYYKPLAITLGTGLGSAFSDYGNTRDADLWSSPFKQGIAEDYFRNVTWS
jgi:glucokinase